MKKTLYFLVFLVCCCGFSQIKKEYNIGILMDNRTPEIAPLMSKLQHEIKAVVGEDAIIKFSEQSNLVNNYDLKQAELNYKQLIANDTDIIIAFGAVNNLIITQQTVHKKPTILFGAINRDLIAFDDDQKESGVENLTYLIESESYVEDLKRFKELTGFKNVGIVIEEAMTSILPIETTFDKALHELNAAYKLIPYKNVGDITSNLEDIDALYIAGGFFLTPNEIKDIANLCLERKIPSFTVTGIEDVKSGLMATNQNEENIDQFFRRIALNIERYINGTPLSKMPIYIEYKSRLTINYNTAELVNVPIKYSLIADTDFVGDFKNAIAKKQYDLLTVINEVLTQNLSLQASKKDVALAEQNVKTAKSNYLPGLTASGTGTYIDPDVAEISNGQNPEFSTSGNLTLTQTIFSEAANANITIQKNLQKAQEESFNASELDAIFDISNAYFNTLILKSNVIIRLRNLDLTKKNLALAEQNYEAGQSGKSDLLRFRSEMAQNTQAMVEAANQLEQGFVILNQLLNNPVNYEIDVEDVELDKGIFEKYNYDRITELLDDPALREPFIDFLIKEAQENAPELKSLDYNLKATDRNIKLNGVGRFLPTLALQGQYNRTFSRSGVGSTFPQGFPASPDGNYNVGLSLSIPILNSNQTNIQRQTAVIQKEQLQLNQENTQLAIAANVRNGVLNLINQITNIELSKISEETAKESLELSQTAYASGAVNVVQLLDAQNNYLNAQLARISATYNYLVSSLQLERYLGYYFLLNSDSDNDKFRQRFLEFLNNRNE